MLNYKITTDFDEWEKVRSNISDYLNHKKVCQAEIISFMVAAEEMFANISSYGYGGNVGDVLIQAQMLEDNIFQLDYYDTGIPFNPLQIDIPDINAPTFQRKIGGLGIYMARKKTDDMRYEYADGKNHLTLIKKF